MDDTDGLDPEGEFEAWKLRELTRLKRDREARYACVLPSPCFRRIRLSPTAPFRWLILLPRGLVAQA